MDGWISRRRGDGKGAVKMNALDFGAFYTHLVSSLIAFHAFASLGLFLTYTRRRRRRNENGMSVGRRKKGMFIDPLLPSPSLLY